MTAKKKTTKKKTTRAKSNQVELKYDAAQTTPSNARHWLAADGLSGIESNSEGVRQVLRNRSRYEVSNDTIAHGIIKTLVDDTVGTTPRLQLSSDAGTAKVDELVEKAFKKWATANKLAKKSRLMRRAKIVDGEAFLVLSRGAAVASIAGTLFPVPAVQLGLQLVEAEQVATGYINQDDSKVSGIDFDRYNNPTRYHILKDHPGSSGTLGLESDSVPAAMMVHWFNQARAGDARGIPEITPALELFALRRRYTLATCEAAEHISNIVGIMQTDAPADGDSTEEYDEDNEFDTVDFARGQIMTLPAGYKYTQADAKHPTATFVQFQHELIGQIARCLNIPFNIAAGNSSSYNYASGRLDHQGYRKAIEIERSDMVETMLDPVFWAWFQEATLVQGYLPAAARTASYRQSLDTAWYFDGAGHVDPVKEAKGQAERLANGTTTLAVEAAREGRDWKDIARQRSEEQKFYETLGMVAPGLPGATATDPVDTQDLDDDDAPQGNQGDDAEKQEAEQRKQ